MKIAPYLFFDGVCEQAFKFYEKALGAKIEAMMHFKDMPGGDSPVPADAMDKVMHARMSIDGQIIMASDAMGGRYNKPQGYDINITVDTPEEADRLFKNLSDGAQSINMPIAETFWALRFGALVDKFGIPWMVNCEKKM